MSYTQDTGILLGKKKIGLTLKAQLVDSTGAPVGSEITTGFTEIGDGNYLWHYESFPDGFRGGMKILNVADDSLLAFASVNPADLSPTGLDKILVETGVNARQAMSIMSAVLAGVLSTNDAGVVTIKAINNAITRVSANTTVEGDRTSITVDLPA